MPTISPISLVRNGECDGAPPTSTTSVPPPGAPSITPSGSFDERARSDGDLSFRELERELRQVVFGVGRALVVLFLALREQHVISQREAGRFEWFGRTFRPRPRSRAT